MSDLKHGSPGQPIGLYGIQDGMSQSLPLSSHREQLLAHGERCMVVVLLQEEMDGCREGWRKTRRSGQGGSGKTRDPVKHLGVGTVFEKAGWEVCILVKTNQRALRRHSLQPARKGEALACVCHHRKVKIHF